MKKYTPLPRETKAFFCADCGAVALDTRNVCKIQGKGTKGDWCGTNKMLPVIQCVNHKNVTRYKCQSCGQIAINPELLCEPKKLPAEVL